MIKGIADIAKLNITNITLHLSNSSGSRYNDLSCVERDEYVKDYARSILNQEPDILNGYISHERTLILENDNFELIIQPDGGIERGWKVDNRDIDSRWEDTFSKDVSLYNSESRKNGILYTIVYKKNSIYK
jgi:hypothetical protein